MNNIQFQYKPRRQQRPSRYIIQRALGLSPNSYKQQLSTQLMPQFQQQPPVQRNSVKHRTPSYYLRTQEPEAMYQPSNQQSSRISQNKEYVRNLISQRRQVNNQRKEEMMRKVKELQDKVLPMIQNEREEVNMNEFGWQNRIQQNILKLETRVDQMKNELEIQMEKRLIQVEQKWQQKFQQIQAIVQASLYSSRQNP